MDDLAAIVLLSRSLGFLVFSVMVGRNLLLVFQDLAVELVGQKIDRRIHVVAFCVRMQAHTFGMNSSLCLVAVLLYMQYHIGCRDVVEATLDSCQFLGRITSQRLGNRHILAAHRDLHKYLFMTI